jgi:hypothetical protein
VTYRRQWTGERWVYRLEYMGNSGPVTIVSASDPAFEGNVTTLSLGHITGLLETVENQDDNEDPQFIDVTDEGFASRAVNGVGYDPIPIPAELELVIPANGLWLGDDLTVNGAYFDTMAGNNIAFMGGRLARASSVVVSGDYATSATFEIPEDARGGPLHILAHGKSSLHDTVPELTLYPTSKLTADPHIPYTEIRGISFCYQTGNVWIAADGVIQELDIFKETPTVEMTITTETKPYLSRVADNGLMVFIDGGAVGNPTIYYVDTDEPGRPVDTFAITTDSGFTRPILPRGIALNRSASKAYIADASGGAGGGKMVKVPANNGAPIEDAYGNLARLDKSPIM